MSDKKSMLVIFDLDETLIHSRLEQLEEEEADFHIAPLLVYQRHFASELILSVADRFDVAIWSAGSKAYVEQIVDRLVPDDVEPVFVWDREDCTKKFDFFPFQVVFTKDLNRVTEFGYDLSNTLIIEDDPVKIEQFRDNTIMVRQFYGDRSDRDLEMLARFFDELELVEDVRKLDKNAWAFKTDIH